MNGLSGRYLCLAGVAVMAFAGCSAGLWPVVDAALTAVFDAALVALLLTAAVIVGRWAYREWLWRQDLRRPVCEPVPAAAATSEAVHSRPGFAQLVEVGS
jgi:hypothetical protein